MMRRHPLRARSAAGYPRRPQHWLESTTSLWS